VTIQSKSAWLLVFAIVAFPLTVAADETDDLIRQIVAKTTTRADAAAKLIENAKVLTDAPAVQVRICAKAYEYGIMAPAGYSSALAALDLLDKVAPADAPARAEKRLEVYRLQYLRGDRAARPVNGRTYVQALLALARKYGTDNKWTEAAKYFRQANSAARALNMPERPAIYKELRAAERRMGIENRVTALKAAVRKNPQDTTSRTRLVETYLVELDLPHEAARYLSDALNPTLRTNVALAAKDASELADADFLTLGRWYRKLVMKVADKQAKFRLLTRARDNLRMYLEVYAKKDVQYLRVTTELKSVQAELDRLGGPAKPSAVKWIDLLGLVDPAKDTVDGEWSRKGTDVRCAQSESGQVALVGIPATAVGSYDLQATLTLKSGTEASISLPVGAGQVALLVGLRYEEHSHLGLGMIDGKALMGDNPTAVKLADPKVWLRVGAKATIDVSVRIKGEQAGVTVTLNGKKVVAWTGKQSALTWHPSRAPPAKTFGLAAYKSEVVWHTVRLRHLDTADRTVKWVSADATYKPSSAHSQFASLPGFLTCRGKLYDRSHTFHTAKQSDPYVIVTLRQVEAIKRILISNRRGEHARHTTGLVVDLSSDGRRWRTAWRAKDVRQSWQINFRTPIRARYVRIRRSGDETYLALAGVQVFAAGP